MVAASLKARVELRGEMLEVSMTLAGRLVDNRVMTDMLDLREKEQDMVRRRDRHCTSHGSDSCKTETLNHQLNLHIVAVLWVFDGQLWRGIKILSIFYEIP